MALIARLFTALLGLLCLAPSAFAESKAMPQVSAYPLLSYDPNLNGGSPDKPIYVLGLPFRFPDDQIQKSGVLIGAGLSVQGQFDPTNRLRITYSGSFEAAKNPDYGFSVQRKSARLCALGFPAPRNMLTFCAGRRLEDRALKSERQTDLELTLGQSTPLGHGALAQNWYALGRAHIDSYWQNRVSTRFGLSLANGKSLQLGATLFQPVDGVMSQRGDLRASLGGKIAGRHVNGTLSFGQSAGAEFFGTDRVDRTARLALSVELRRNLAMTVGYSHTNSSADYYDQNSLDILFNILGAKF